MSPLEYGEVETDQGSTPPRDRRLTRERILQHVQPAAQVVSADGVPGAGQADARRASCSRVHMLGAVRSDAVLPARPGPLAAGDLWGAAQQRGQAQAPRDHGPESLDARLRERTSALATLPGRVRGVAAPVPAPGPGPAEVPVQEQAGQSGLDGDRPVRDPVRLGEVPADERGGQAALPVGPRWLPAERGGHHRGQAA